MSCFIVYTALLSDIYYNIKWWISMAWAYLQFLNEADAQGRVCGRQNIYLESIPVKGRGRRQAELERRSLSMMQTWQSFGQAGVGVTPEWVQPIRVAHSELKRQSLYIPQDLYTPAVLSQWAHAAPGKRMSSDRAAHSSWGWLWAGCELEAACWPRFSQHVFPILDC